jgi:hypothetical protein
MQRSYVESLLSFLQTRLFARQAPTDKFFSLFLCFAERSSETFLEENTLLCFYVVCKLFCRTSLYQQQQQQQQQLPG